MCSRPDWAAGSVRSTCGSTNELTMHASRSRHESNHPWIFSDAPSTSSMADRLSSPTPNDEPYSGRRPTMPPVWRWNVCAITRRAVRSAALRGGRNARLDPAVAVGGRLGEDILELRRTLQVVGVGEALHDAGEGGMAGDVGDPRAGDPHLAAVAEALHVLCAGAGRHANRAATRPLGPRTRAGGSGRSAGPPAGSASGAARSWRPAPRAAACGRAGKGRARTRRRRAAG